MICRVEPEVLPLRGVISREGPLVLPGSFCNTKVEPSLLQLSACKSRPGRARYSPGGRTGRPRQKSNYELFNRNNFNIRYWSWNYRGCWHQTCPPMGTRKNIFVQPIPITRHGCPVLLFFVTTSLCQDWVICAPAAFLRCGSHSSGSLSGIKP